MGVANENTFVNGGDTAMGRPVRKGEAGRTNHVGIFLQERNEQSSGSDERIVEGQGGHNNKTAWPEERMKIEEKPRARISVQRQEFHATARLMVSKSYGRP